MATKNVTLVSPKGREWTTDSPTEITDLKAQGYRVKPVPKPAPKPVPAPTSK